MFSTPITIRKVVSTFVSPAKTLIHRRKTEKSTTTSIFDLVSAVDSVKDVKQPVNKSNKKKSSIRVFAYLNQLHYDDVPEVIQEALPLITVQMRAEAQIPADAPPCYETVTLLLDDAIPIITTPVLEPSSPTPSVESDDGPLTPTLDAASIAELIAPAPTPVADAVSVQHESVSVSDDEDSSDNFEDADNAEGNDYFELMARFALLESKDEQHMFNVNLLATGKMASLACVRVEPVVESDDEDDEVIDVEEEEEEVAEPTSERVNCQEHSSQITAEELHAFIIAKGRFGRKPDHPRVAFLRRHGD